MNIKKTLLNYFKTPFIPLDKIAIELLGCTIEYSKKLALEERLPFDTFRFYYCNDDELEAPWLIYIDDLVQFIKDERSPDRYAGFQYKRLASENPI